MNAGSDRLAIGDLSHHDKAHSQMRKKDFHGWKYFNRGLPEPNWHGPSWTSLPLAFPTFISPGGELPLPLRGKYECRWPFVGVCRDQWIPLSLLFPPDLAKLRQFPISRADTGTKAAPIERENIFNSVVSQE